VICLVKNASQKVVDHPSNIRKKGILKIKINRTLTAQCIQYGMHVPCLQVRHVDFELQSRIGGMVWGVCWWLIMHLIRVRIDCVLQYIGGSQYV
jgi:hypothetical protein